MLRPITLKKVTRILLWLLITLVTIIVLLFVWTNWSGKRRWAATQAQIEREGETLNYRKLLPATLPVSANLLAIAPLRGIAEVVDSDASKGEPGAKRQALEGLKWELGEVKTPSLLGIASGRKSAFADWVRVANAARLAEVAVDSPQAGRELLAALDAKLPVLKQLADESVKRPQALFTPALSERELPGLLFSLQIPHYTIAQKLGLNLALRARAAAAADDRAEVANTLLALSRISQACMAEPMLIGFLVGLNVEAQASEVLWEVLEQRLLQEAELRLLQHELEQTDLDAALLLSMRGEMAVGIGSLAYLEDVMAGRKKDDRLFDNDLIGAPEGRLNPKLLRALPSGLISHWKSAVGEVELRHLLQPLKAGGIRAAFQARDALEQELVSKSNPFFHPDYLMARLIVPAIAGISQSALMAQTRQRQALTALALERAWLKHGRYPAKLDELVPEFLSAVPLDPCDGKVMRYRTTAAGRYLLWSVAFDGKDDAGTVSVSDPAKTSALRKPQYLGDWAWQYEPVAK